MKFLKYDDHSEGELLICILVCSLSFLNLNCNSWILTMIEGHFEQLFFHMDLKWDFWLLSGNWSFHAFFCLVLLAGTILKPAWSFPLLSLAFGPSCAFVRKRRVKSQKSHLRSIWKNNCSMWPSIIVRNQELQFKFRITIRAHECKWDAPPHFDHHFSFFSKSPFYILSPLITVFLLPLWQWSHQPSSHPKWQCRMRKKQKKEHAWNAMELLQFLNFSIFECEKLWRLPKQSKLVFLLLLKAYQVCQR